MYIHESVVTIENKKKSGRISPENRRHGTALSSVYERITTARAPSADIESNRSAVTNQRAVRQSSLCVRTGRSQRGAVSFSATSCTRVSIKMSLTRFAPISVVVTSANPPTEVSMTGRKALGLIQGGPS